MKYVSLACLLLFTIGWANANGNQIATDTLKVGDPAPPIVVRKWIKGTPVTQFQSGMVYVVEFWATWCGPCQAAMPHLSDLAEKYKDKAIVLSIDVKEDKKTDFLPKVERLVKYSGDRMRYTIAVDATGDIMEKTWLNAIGSNGIPELFIIDQQGKIAWHGHPNFVDDVLEAVVNGNYDEAGKKRIEAALKEKNQLYDSLSHKMMAARSNGDYQTALAMVEKILPIFPGLRAYCSNMKYEFLSHLDSAKARQLGEDMMAHLSSKDQLNQIYFILVAKPNSSFNPDYGFALKWAERAAAHSDPEDKGPVKTLAQVYYKMGNKKKAVEYQKKFIQMIKNDPASKPQWVEIEQKTLQQYESSGQ